MNHFLFWIFGISLMVFNLYSCERTGMAVTDFFGFGEAQTVFYDGRGDLNYDGDIYKIQMYEKEGTPWRKVKVTWVYYTFFSFALLCVIFPPYRWMLWGILLAMLYSSWNRN